MQIKDWPSFASYHENAAFLLPGVAGLCLVQTTHEC
jgi:hypothetical protein